MIRDGLWRWTVPHPDWQPSARKDSSADWPREVGCLLYETAGSAIFIDPLETPEPTAFWRWVDGRCAGRRVVVLTTNRFHRRSRDAFVERYGASTSRARASLPRAVRSIPVRGAGETMFWLPEHRALISGDRVIGGEDGSLRLCPASWLRYLPSAITVAQLRELLRPLLELPIELVLVSHGEPVLADGHRALARALA
ncbi:MAG: hypothetical protein ABSG95_12425 [Solirubrobacteraceae bacterium]